MIQNIVDERVQDWMMTMTKTTYYCGPSGRREEQEGECLVTVTENRRIKEICWR